MSNDLNYSVVIGSALRYALGRRSYVVSCTVEYILANLDKLQGQTKAVMLRDINECKDYGETCDRVMWDKLREALTNDIDSQSSITHVAIQPKREDK